jgi:hypothetical protein
MGTTLWFTPEDLKGKEANMLQTLIACGQFTACFNLLEYFEKVLMNPIYADSYNQYSEILKNQLKSLYSRMFEDWRKFNSDPYWMIESILQ